jgi:hypothetical protein
MKSLNVDAEAKFNQRIGRNNGWNEMLDLKKQLDYGQHIGKIVTVEKPIKKGEMKDDNSTSSTLVPGIGVMQQLFVTTNFLDAPDNKQEEDRKDDGLDNVSIESPNLLDTMDDEQDETATILEKDTTPPLEPSHKSWRPQMRCCLVEQGRGHGGKLALPARSFPVFRHNTANRQETMMRF